MNVTTALLRAAFCISLAAPSLLIAQQPSYLVAPDSPAGIGGSDSATANSAVVRGTTPAPAAKDAKPLTGRWLDLTAMSSSFRFRNAFNQAGTHLFDNGQQKMLIVSRFKLDAQERYTINLRASSGGYFNWSYADVAGMGLMERQHDGLIAAGFTKAEAAERSAAAKADPVGLALSHAVISTGWHFYLRELYFSATPIKAVTAEFGSLGIERGYASEITTFDDDGWVTGERVRIKDPQHLYFDQIGFTSGFLGNIGTPNFFDRGADLKSSNYRQVFLKKQIDPRIGVSGEYAWLAGAGGTAASGTASAAVPATDTLGGAVSIGVKESRVLDSIHIEAYDRLNTVLLQGLSVKDGAGAAITVDKQITSRLGGDFGYANIDRNYSVDTGHRVYHAVGFALNGDSYGVGKRPFVHGTYKVNSAVTAFGFYTHNLGSRGYVDLNQQNLNVGLTFDLKAMANTGKRVF